MPRKRTLDPEAIMQLCKKFGSYYGATKALALAGVVNPSTGKPFTRAGVYLAAKRAPGWKEWEEQRKKAQSSATAELVEVTSKILHEAHTEPTTEGTTQ
jgi:hypothetical protein